MEPNSLLSFATLIVTAILSPIIVGYFTMRINVEQKRSMEAIERQGREADEKREAARAEADKQRQIDAEWRSNIEARLDTVSGQLKTINSATQATMRTELLHLSEKYITRSWITNAERDSLFDMHKKYAALDADGYIDNCIERAMQLPIRDI